ncbi:hypothetical protein SUGI_0154700 [Cryptomeria japonica]|nr:hypothetical protein SUGI_0154700 [Cryptomeria japonica]
MRVEFENAIVIFYSHQHIKEEGINEALEEEINRLFNKANDKERDSVICILGVNFWNDDHVHDGVVMGNLFDLIVQVVGNSSAPVGIVRRMVREDIYEEVLRGLDDLKSAPQSECMLGFFNLNVAGKKV